MFYLVTCNNDDDDVGTAEGECGLISKHVHRQLARCNPLFHIFSVLVPTGFVLVGQKKNYIIIIKIIIIAFLYHRVVVTSEALDFDSCISYTGLREIKRWIGEHSAVSKLTHCIHRSNSNSDRDDADCVVNMRDFVNCDLIIGQVTGLTGSFWQFW